LLEHSIFSTAFLEVLHHTQVVSYESSQMRCSSMTPLKNIPTILKVFLVINQLNAQNLVL